MTEHLAREVAKEYTLARAHRRTVHDRIPQSCGGHAEGGPVPPPGLPPHLRRGMCRLPERTQCLPGLFQSALWPAGAASCGACVTSKDKCPHDGEPCQLVGGTCAGMIRCLNDKTTCVLRDPSCLE